MESLKAGSKQDLDRETNILTYILHLRFDLEKAMNMIKEQIKDIAVRGQHFNNIKLTDGIAIL